jgi:hypothetical protein
VDFGGYLYKHHYDRSKGRTLLGEFATVLTIDNAVNIFRQILCGDVKKHQCGTIHPFFSTEVP